MINVNGKELDYDEAIRFIEEEKANELLGKQRAEAEKIIRENLVVVSVTEKNGTESLVFCFADTDRKYDFAMASVERVFGRKYHLDAKNAYKRYTTKTIEKPGENIKKLARKLCSDNSLPRETVFSFTTEGKSVPVYVFRYIDTAGSLKGATQKSPGQDCYPGADLVEAFLRDMFGVNVFIPHGGTYGR